MFPRMRSVRSHVIYGGSATAQADRACSTELFRRSRTA
jgi:hypothetical protein